MSKKSCAIFLLVFSCYSANLLQGRSTHPYVSARCAKEQSRHFEHVKKQVDLRWDDFKGKNSFALFKPGKSDEELEAEFSSIITARKQAWTKSSYKKAAHLLSNNLVRYNSCVAFAYNNTVDDYNASTVVLGDKIYIACEGPRSRHMPNFFGLLHKLQATHLVRLTGSREGKKVKCHPYWKEHVRKAADGSEFLHIPDEHGSGQVRAYDMAEWKDNQGIDPSKLLRVMLNVRKELQDCNGLLAVHCSAGVGRTGTFLAALAIVDVIDSKKPLSISEIVYKISLQRIYGVSTPSQYITLYRLAELYQGLNNN